MKRKMLAVLLALAVTLAGSYAVLAKNTNAVKHSQQPPELTADVDTTDDAALTAAQPGSLTLNDYSITLAPDEKATIKGTLKKVDSDIESVDWDVDGVEMISVNIAEKVEDSFKVAITADQAANDGDECTINFTVTAQDGSEYSAALAVTIEAVSDEDINEDEDEDEDSDNDTVKEDNPKSSPAAPAIANKLLNEAPIKIKHRGAYISEIAKQTGKDGELNKKAYSDRDAYADAVRDYLEDQDLDLGD